MKDTGQTYYGRDMRHVDAEQTPRSHFPPEAKGATVGTSLHAAMQVKRTLAARCPCARQGSQSAWWPDKRAVESAKSSMCWCDTTPISGGSNGQVAPPMLQDQSSKLARFACIIRSGVRANAGSDAELSVNVCQRCRCATRGQHAHVGAEKGEPPCAYNGLADEVWWLKVTDALLGHPAYTHQQCCNGCA